MPDKSIIHVIAVAGGTSAGSLPIGLDVAALQAEELIMVIKIGKEFGVSLTKTAAAAVLTAAGCTVVGTAVFATLNVGYPFTIPAKVATAIGVIEAAGHLVYKYFEERYGK